MQMTSKPHMSKVSAEIVRNKGDQLKSYKDTNYYFERQKQIEDLKRVIDNEKFKDITGKPQISDKAQSLNRDVNDLFNWQKENQRKKED